MRADGHRRIHRRWCAGHAVPATGDARGGMATRGEAEQALGMGRLRAAREIIRPDLYGADASKGNG